MDHPEGAGLQRADRLDFDRRVRLEFRGAQLNSDGGLLVMRELDDALGLSDLASPALCDSRRDKNTVHGVEGLFPRVGFIVTDLPMEPVEVTRFYNRCGAAEQHIKEGKYAFHWTRLSYRRLHDSEVRLQLRALACNLGPFLRCIELHEEMADWSLTSLQLKLIKIEACMVRHARAITFHLAEVAVTGPMVRAIPTTIHRLRALPLCA